MMHEPDHGDDKGGGGEHHPAFDDVGVELEARDKDGGDDGGGERGSDGVEDRAFELDATDFGEVGEDDADDQGGFDAFSQGDDKCLVT